MMSLAQTVKYFKDVVNKYTSFINGSQIENSTKTKVANYINGTEGGSKSIRNVIKEKTFKNLPPKIGYFDETTVSITTNASSLICQLQETPLFLGGYYTLVEVQDITLKPNATNYIYFHRNSTDYKKVDIEVSQSPRSDVDGFSRVLIIKITTNANGPVSQEYNHIDNYRKRK